MIIVVGMQTDADLVKIVLAFGPIASLASLLHRWKKQGNQDTYDGNHNQKFDQGKSPASSS
jgi:hypothetical protein